MPEGHDSREHLCEFRTRMEQARRTLEPVDFRWYAYDILSNVPVLEELAAAADLTLEEMAAGQPLLDIGCADGHLSFYLESLGYSVTAVDNPPTGDNRMRGVRALQQALGSSVEIIEADIDRDFVPPRANYGLVVLMGILYHLKNPFLILETLAGVADYCFLSTRIARFTPDGARLQGLPVAYLLGEVEANNDNSNYWIFSETGLMRLLDRAGWDVRASAGRGNQVNSDPASAEGDERIYCLLSRKTLFTNGRLREGWHPAEGPRSGWRWTERRFAIDFSSAPGPREVVVDLFVADGHSPTITAFTGVSEVAAITLTPGTHQWRFALPDAESARIRVDFTVSGGSPPSPDQRALGVIVSQIHLRTAAAAGS
jgi:SAM-dependent methyltransferase